VGEVTEAKPKGEVKELIDMNETILNQLTITRYLIRLRFREPASFQWLHGPAVSALLCRAFGRHPLGQDVAVYPAESGVIDFCEQEHYHFGVTLFGPDNGRFDCMVAGLRREGERPCKTGTTGFPLFEVAEAVEIPHSQFPGCANVSQFDLRLITPLRMERKNPLRGKRYFDTTFFDGGRFLHLLYNRAYDLARLSAKELPPYVLPEVPAVSVEDMELLWVDAPFHGGEKTCGGVIGTVRLSAALDEQWQRLLHVGQIIQAGRNSALGFGVYSCRQLPLEKSIAPAQSMIRRIVEQSNLEKAFEHVRCNSDAANTDDESPVDCSHSSLNELAHRVTNRTYKPAPLRGVVIPKSDGKTVRTLAIPGFIDRVLQRAAVQALGPGIDTLLEESSYAYRRGLSRKSAAHAIDRARREGYNIALASDVNAFFDTVSWKKMQRKICALYNEPQLVELLGSWLCQDVLFRGQRIKRSRGLAQGASISPLLANLCLDEFDEALGDDFRLVRYADDFVVLCRSEEEAKRALEQAQKALGRLALEIKREKTGIVDFERGFQYLGYLFCRSLVMEKKQTESGDRNVQEIPEESIPPESWLTHVDFRKTRVLENPAATGFRKIHEEENGTRMENGITVYLSDPCVMARLSGNTLELSRLDDSAAERSIIPLENIAAVVDYGKPSMTMHALTGLAKRAIPVYFCNNNGEVYLTVPGLTTNYDLWSSQEECRQNKTVTCGFARAVVCAKIRNYSILCRRQEWTGDAPAKLRILEEKCESGAGSDSIRGYEGKAAAIWFSLVKEHLDPQWGFTGRVRHPPSDPINAMLSFGYSCLYHHISTALQMRGLNPKIGWFHECRPDYHALACDIQEEFRHIIDSLVLYLLHRNMVSPDCFVINNEKEQGGLPCVMQKEFRKVFLGHLEERLLTEFIPEGGESPVSYREFFLQQAHQIEEICRNPGKPYLPLRIR